MSDFGAILIQRLDKAANRNQLSLDNIQGAKERIAVRVIPVLEKDLVGNEVALAAIREVYGLLESDAEARQSTITELKEAKDLLEKTAALLEQAGYDFANIQTFSNDEIWLADHLETIKRVVEIVNLQKLEVALDETDKERFEDIAHTVKRSGEKRQAASIDPESDAAVAALVAVEAMKVATALIPDAPEEATGE